MVFKIIFSVSLVYRAQNPARVSHSYHIVRQILGYYTAGANHHIVTHCDSGNKNSPRTNPAVSSDVHRHILDGIIDKLVRQIFERMKAIPKSEIVSARYREKMEQRKSLLHSVRSEYVKAAADLETLKGEVIKTIRGESSFSKELLNSLIAEAETKCRELQENLEAAQAAYDEGQAVMASLNTQYNDIISWAEMYDTASIEAKKMIVSCLIKRVEVYRDYKLHIDFNIDFTQFCEGLDIVTIAA